MAVRQELLYYVRGNPAFNIEAEYTDIPKTLRGYYKDVGGERTENLERGKRDTIRAGNVWVDIQQVFYRLQENVSRLLRSETAEERRPHYPRKFAPCGSCRRLLLPFRHHSLGG